MEGNQCRITSKSAMMRSASSEATLSASSDSSPSSRFSISCRSDEMGENVPGGGRHQRDRDICIDACGQGIGCARGIRQRRQDLGLSHVSMRDQCVNAGDRICHRVPVAGVQRGDSVRHAEIA